MVFVIGQASVVSVTGGGNSDWQGITSFSFNTGATFNPLFQLNSAASSTGEGFVYAVDVSASPSVSLSLYSGFDTEANSGHYSVTMPTSCTDSDLVANIVFTPGLCGSNYGSIFSLGGTEDFFITSYSYSKDVSGFGTESWSFQGKPDPAFLIPGSHPATSFSSVMSGLEEPSVEVVMVNGIATGNVSGDFSQADLDDTKLVFDRITDASSVANNKEVSVSAGNVSIGNANVTFNGFVREFGGATLFRRDGIVLNASVTIPVNPVYNTI
jgi:hypothetical protein